MKRFLVLLLVLGASAAYGEVYTWRDVRGTVFYTNSLHEIPARYLKKARVLDVATGKKGGAATAQPGSQALPAQTSAQQAPAPTQLATPAPPIPSDANPAAANSAPPPIPPAAVEQPQRRPTGSTRRAPRRQRGMEEEE